MKKIITIIVSMLVILMMVGCDDKPSGQQVDAQKTVEVASTLQGNQPTPTDISYSLERFNLIRRAYWVNGMREKAMLLTIPIPRPLGYVVLLSDSGAVVGKFVVDGKVSSLQNYLTPVSEYYEKNGSGSDGRYYNNWLTDTDGTYGDNGEGIFFFTTDGKYLEWSGTYLFSDIPFEVSDPILKTEGK